MKFYTMRKYFVVLSLLLAVGLWGCAPPTKGGEPDSRLNLAVSIVPQQYFVERIGGEHVLVRVMVEPGASPATYEPKPEQLKDLSVTTAYFSIGVPFENVWLDKIAAANTDMLIVDTLAQVERLPLAMDAHADEGEDADEEDHEHATGAPDPHVWLSPRLVKLQAQTIYEALVQLDPAHQDDYAANLAAFLDDIDVLQRDIQTALAGLKSDKFMVFHPSWGYFAHDFGLQQISIEVGGQEPSAQELAALIEHAQEEGVRVIFAQPEFSTQDAQTIAQEIGGEVLLISPLERDWLANMRKVAQTFGEVLSE